MTEGISNFQIEEAFKNIGDEDIDTNFVSTFPSNYMNKFINNASMVSEKKENVRLSQFILCHRCLYKQGTHCWSIRDIEPKTNIFFFHTFGIDGIKSFITQDDKKVIEKILLGTEK